MFCSNCGLEINEKQIHKALERDAKNANSIKYLSNALVVSKKYALKLKLNDLKKELSKEEFNSKKQELKNELNSEIAAINAKKKENDLNYFKSVLNINESRTNNTSDYFVCPRCGKLVKNNLDENDIKSLARAGHSEIHRGRNNISSGMCALMIGIILAIVGFMFLALSFKATNGGVLDTTCVEFYVFIFLVLFALCLLVYSFVSIFKGKNKIKRYELLLRNINNGAFHQ